MVRCLTSTKEVVGVFDNLPGEPPRPALDEQRGVFWSLDKNDWGVVSDFEGVHCCQDGLGRDAGAVTASGERPKRVIKGMGRRSNLKT